MQSNRNWTWPTIGFFALTGTLWLVRDDSRAQGATAPPFKVGVVNMERLFNEFQQTKDIDAILKQRGGAMSQQRVQKQDALNQARLVLDSYHPDSPEALAQRRRIRKLDAKLRAFWQTVVGDTDWERTNWTFDTYEKILQAVEQVATRRGVDVVFSFSPPAKSREGRDFQSLQREMILRSVVYRAGRIDMTNEVLARANSQYVAAGGARTINVLIGPE